jgi:hypothetical protein
MLTVSPPCLWRLSMTESSVARSLKTRGFAMDRFIHEQNLAHYRKILSETTDPKKRQTVLKLLADEQAKLRPQPQKP